MSDKHPMSKHEFFESAKQLTAEGMEEGDVRTFSLPPLLLPIQIKKVDGVIIVLPPENLDEEIPMCPLCDEMAMENARFWMQIAELNGEQKKFEDSIAELCQVAIKKDDRIKGLELELAVLKSPTTRQNSELIKHHENKHRTEHEFREQLGLLDFEMDNISEAHCPNCAGPMINVMTIDQDDALNYANDDDEAITKAIDAPWTLVCLNCASAYVA